MNQTKNWRNWTNWFKGSWNASSPPPPSSDEEEIEIEFSHRRERDSASIHDFTGLPNGIKQSAVPNISPESSPFTIFFLPFQQIFVILLRNRYFHQHVASPDEASMTAQQPDITMEEMYWFSAIIIRMGHDQLVSKITGAENNISLRFTLIWWFVTHFSIFYDFFTLKMITLLTMTTHIMTGSGK